MRRRVRWLSLTLLDFGLLVFSACGSTCAAHMAGANHSPPTTTTRRRQRVPNLNICNISPDLRCHPEFLPIPMHEPCQRPALPGNFAQLRDTTRVKPFQATTKLLSNKTLILMQPIVEQVFKPELLSFLSL